jgi:hypothetical protein
MPFCAGLCYFPQTGRPWKFQRLFRVQWGLTHSPERNGLSEKENDSPCILSLWVYIEGNLEEQLI